MPTFPAGSGQKILLIGDVGKVFLDNASISEQRCEVCASMPDGIDAAKNSFAAIGVVMGGRLTAEHAEIAEEKSKLKISASSAHSAGKTLLSSALKSLKRANPEAKIILLAQMYQEPIARKLVSANSADDYLICPIKASQLSRFIGQADATLERKIKELEKLATEDDLTGLKNRRYIWEFARQILEHAGKANTRVTLLIFDIDNFKHYNDVYGHSVGDKILKQAAILMRRCCRAHDVVGRVGGDEFAVVFWDDPISKIRNSRRKGGRDHPQEAILIANRFREELEKAEWSAAGGLGPKGEGVLTISGGLASFPRDGSTAQQLFQRADKALLEAKRSGKNRIYLVGKPLDTSGFCA